MFLRGGVFRLREESVSVIDGALRKGPPFYGSQSSGETKTQNAKCRMAGCEVTRSLSCLSL